VEHLGLVHVLDDLVPVTGLASRAGATSRAPKSVVVLPATVSAISMQSTSATGSNGMLARAASTA